MIGRETHCMNGKKLRYGLVFIVLTTLIYMLMELRYGLPGRNPDRIPYPKPE